MGPLRHRLRDYCLITLINLALAGLLITGLRDPRDTALRVEPAPTRAPQPSATPFRMLVHVTGAVGRPGLVRLAEGARVDDAIRGAGGLAADAAPGLINLAAYVADGLQLHVPAEGETAAGIGLSLPSGTGSRGPAPAAGPGASSFGQPATSSTAPMAGGPGGAATGQIKVNSATASELEQLPGIGPALAARIVAHRDALGPFASAQDLLEVSGIGEKTLARFESMIVVP